NFFLQINPNFAEGANENIRTDAGFKRYIPIRVSNLRVRRVIAPGVVRLPNGRVYQLPDNWRQGRDSRLVIRKRRNMRRTLPASHGQGEKAETYGDGGNFCFLQDHHRLKS